MQSVLDFIQTYWTYISAVILILIEVLILILKKRPKTIDDFMSCLDKVLNDLPRSIKFFEEPGKGEKKKELVISNAFVRFKRYLGRDLSDTEYHIAEKAFSEQIEVILSTPQKKGAQEDA